MSDFQDSNNQLEGFEEGPTIPPERPTGAGRAFAIAVTVIVILLLAALVGLGIVLYNRNPPSSTDQAARINAQNTQIAAAATEQVRIAQLQQTVDAAILPTATIPPTAAPIVPTAQVGATNTSVVAIPTATNTPIPSALTVLPADQTKTAAAKTSIALGTIPVGGGTGASTTQANATVLPADQTMTAAAQTSIALGTIPVGGGTGASTTQANATVLPADQTKTAAAKTSIALGTIPVGGGTGTSTPQANATVLPNTGFADQAGLPGMIGLAVLLLGVILVTKRLRSSPSH
jgi:LPXTG-motif cell wall-anchored protein